MWGVNPGLNPGFGVLRCGPRKAIVLMELEPTTDCDMLDLRTSENLKARYIIKYTP
jgi:hypothetical protein